MSTPFSFARPGIGLLSRYKLFRVACYVLIMRVLVSTVAVYDHYLPPDFTTGFLHGRAAYFFGAYRWAFYVHLVSGPLSLVLGLLLISDRLRTWSPRTHRTLGKVQGVNVLLLLVPSGLWMSWYAETGFVAATGFATLGLLTGGCMMLAWKTAIQRNFAAHQRWTWRCFLLLSSVVVQRVMGGLGTVLNVEGDWAYQAASWVSWLLPLAAFECSQRFRSRVQKSPTSSPPEIVRTALRVSDGQSVPIR